MREQNAAAGETVIRILEQGNTSAILQVGSEADLVKLHQHPTASSACDCGASTDTRQHPRAWGTFPRVLGHYVRETKALTWEFFFRAEDGIRATSVTGVQTCALPIFETCSVELSGDSPQFASRLFRRIIVPAHVLPVWLPVRHPAPMR